MAKRCVFRRLLKVPSVSDAVTLDGKVFQARGAATKNARSSIVVRHEDGVTRAEDVDEDRSLFLVSTFATRRSSLARYGRAVPCGHRKTRRQNLTLSALAPTASEGHGVAGWCALTSAQSKQVVQQRLSQTVVCRAGCQVDRRASCCHSPGATTPVMIRLMCCFYSFRRVIE